MEKRFKRMLTMLLLAAMLLSNGIFALAAEGTGEGARSDGEVNEPLPTVEGFDYRNVFVSQTSDSSGYNITILEAKTSSSTTKEIVYGIAKFNRETAKAEDMPKPEWVSPDAMSHVTFKDVDAEDIIITTVDRSSAQTMTPAERFNQDKVGIKFVLPTMNLYNALQPLDPAEVQKEDVSITVFHTKTEREYALFDSREGKLVTLWETGTGGELTLAFEKSLFDVVVAVTRVWKSDVPYIEPAVPVVFPGGDVALTQVGFSPRTQMAVLTIQATPGLEYAIAQENGQILSISQRVRWGITAETEDEFNVMADSTNFYSAPAQGKEIRFRVPAGGVYYVVTRFPDGTTSRPDKSYPTKSVEGNDTILGPYTDPDTGKEYALVIINPASQYSQYAARNTQTGETTEYYASTEGVVRFKAYMPTESIEVVARPIPLTGSSEGSSSTGQPSPGRETMPPVLNEHVSGTGETLDGRHLTAGPWDPNITTFSNGKAAVEDALGSGVGQHLNPKNISGVALASVSVDPVTMMVLYDWNGKPSSALYYYDGEWYSAPLVDLEDGTYMVNFREGLLGFIDFAVSSE